MKTGNIFPPGANLMETLFGDPVEIELIKEIQLECERRSGRRVYGDCSSLISERLMPCAPVRYSPPFLRHAIKERVHSLSKHQRCVPNLFVSCSRPALLPSRRIITIPTFIALLPFSLFLGNSTLISSR